MKTTEDGRFYPVRRAEKAFLAGGGEEPAELAELLRTARENPDALPEIREIERAESDTTRRSANRSGPSVVKEL